MIINERVQEATELNMRRTGGKLEENWRHNNPTTFKGVLHVIGGPRIPANQNDANHLAYDGKETKGKRRHIAKTGKSIAGEIRPS
jgi:hypothetical protein